MGGYAFMWKAKYDNLSDNLDRQKEEAQALLEAEQKKVSDHEAKAKLDNATQAIDHEKSNKTIDDLRRSLAATRLSDPGRRNGGKATSPTSDSAGIPQTEAGAGELSAELTRFLQIKFFQADTVAEYANQCYTFVVEKNCGIAKDED